MVTRIKSKRILSDASKTIYCRKCTKDKKEIEFYSAVDALDSNGYMSLCKSCIEDIFQGFMLSTNMSLSDSIRLTCKTINMAYMELAVDSTKSHIETIGDKALNTNIFSIYKSHLGKKLKIDPTFLGTYECDGFLKTSDEDQLVNENKDFKKYLETFWGKGLEWDDYEYLESALAKWKSKHAIATTADEILVRELCFIDLEIMKKRLEKGGDTSKLVKKLQDVMKTAALSPAQANSASNGKTNDTFGEIIKVIEEKTPAEVFDDKELYRDFDGIYKNYIQDFIIRSIGNFTRSVRDFNTSENIETIDSDVEDDISETLKGEATVENGDK